MIRLANINTRDIKAAIELGCRTMGSVFNADDPYEVPFFTSEITPNPHMGWSTCVSESHVPGRHLLALLSAEDAAGIEIPDEVIEKQTRALFLSFSGPVALPLNRIDMHGPVVRFNPHNLREGMHGLYALVKYRQSQRARDMAERMIADMFEYWNPDRGFDWERLKKPNVIGEKQIFIGHEARMIGALVRYYRATGYGPALQLALILKEKAVREFYLEDGTFDGRHHDGHVHSITSTMSSLAQLADVTSDATLLNRVRAFFDNGLRQLRDQLGWAREWAHDHHPTYHPDGGEGNVTGDIIETALILGRWGYTHYYHDVERILRGYLLPSQLRDVSFIVDSANPNNEDGLRNLADRHLGAYGFAAPYGHRPVGRQWLSFNFDAVGAVVSSLCEALRQVTRFDKAVHWVNLLFDHETEHIKVESAYTHQALSVTVKRSGPLFVRMPPWVDHAGLCINGVEQYTFSNDYLFIPEPRIAEQVRIKFDLPLNELVLKHQTHDIRVRLRGDEVAAMDSFGAEMTFFDPYDQQQRI